MSEWNTEQLAEWDKRSVWHPFTAMCEWCAAAHAPVVLVEGRSALLREHEDVIPDIVVLDKGLIHGYLLLAITLISEKLFSALNGSVTEGKALGYGHSYTGNALGCAAGKASLEVFENERVLEAITKVWRCSNASSKKDAKEVTA